MPRRRKTSDSSPFDTLRLEGGLFVAELLERAARGGAPGQDEADYGVPKGLKLHDEYGRSYRIATALWKDFAARMPREDAEPHRTTLHFVRDLLRDTLGYTDLDLPEAPVALSDRAYPIPAFSPGGRVPVVVAPHDLGLDEPDARFAIQGSGARRKSPHQLAQEFLNASPDSTWAIVTNGKTLRLLRDAETLTRPNFLEFDIETILREGEDRYADFSTLWRILHASRSRGTPCLWEKWKTEGQAQGLRVREGLRAGVEAALIALGTGFIAHPDNAALRERLQDGSLGVNDYFQELLRLVYRQLFLFCAEERDLLHDPHSGPAARQTYATGYGLRRLRRRSLRQSALDLHGDLWISTRIVFRALAHGQEKLGLPALGGLFATSQCPSIDAASLANRDLLAAMCALRWFFDKKSGKRSAIDYRNMGTEELGSVYESLLELVPSIDLPASAFGFVGITTPGSTSGNARKTSGSYYTPHSLVQELIKSALDPVIADRLAARPDNPVEALLSITVCDPSCGSGHFLLAAARRLAEKLAELRAPDGAVRHEDYRHALREVISRCIFGVDINPMAVELCRLSLWMEALDPGKPLGFLDHHIRCGNSLLGATPELIAAGLPDDTFTAIEGDDKPACAELKKRNKKEREGFGPLFEKEEQTIRDRLRLAASAVEEMDENDLSHRDQKEAEFRKVESTSDYRHAKLLADLWCAAFVIKKHYLPDESDSRPASASVPNIQPVEGQILHSQDELFGFQPASEPPVSAKSESKARPLKTENWKLKTPYGITTSALRDFVQGKPLPDDLQTEVEALARQYRFFHWHLAFPQVFDQGGFACILGNPPWERVKLQEKEWFAERQPEIARAPNAAARKRLIQLLKTENQTLNRQFLDALRVAEGESHIMRHSGLYPFCGCGDVNLYAVFAERMRVLLNASGRAGCVLPSGIATDDTTKLFFQDVFEKKSLVSLFDFENKGIFPSVHSSFKFCLITCGSGTKPTSESATFVFFAHAVEELRDDTRRFVLSVDDIQLLNPSTKTCPIFRSASDAELTKAMYRAATPLVQCEPRVTFFPKIDMSDEVDEFLKTHEIQEGAPPATPFLHDGITFVQLYESKFVWYFDHRFGTFDGCSRADQEGGQNRNPDEVEKSDANSFCVPRYYVPVKLVDDRYGQLHRRHTQLLTVRRLTNATNERTAVFTLVPYAGCGNSMFVFDVPSTKHAIWLLACGTSLAFDYITRNKLGGTNFLQFIIEQLAVVDFQRLNQEHFGVRGSLLDNWVAPRVLELTYTAWDLEAFAADCGWSGPPFRWDEERRFLLRCELDAAFFHLYLGPLSEWQQQPEALTRAFPTPRHAVSYIMDTFPIVKRKDEAKHGHYRTKETILQIYDALGEAMQTGVAYQTLLNPPPADPTCCHLPRSSQVPCVATTKTDS